jgi:hypothetical protein
MRRTAGFVVSARQMAPPASAAARRAATLANDGAERPRRTTAPDYCAEILK